MASAKLLLSRRDYPVGSPAVRIGWVSMLWAMLLLIVLVLGAIAARAAAPARIAVKHEVLVFYYGWWGTPAVSGALNHWADVDPVARTVGSTAHYPQDGIYDSHDATVIDRQLKQMHAAGITGLISSWWGRDTFEDRSLDSIMREAPGKGLKVSAYYEQVPPAALSSSTQAKVAAVVADLSYLVERHGGDRAWLRVGRRPVIFVFRRAIQQLGLEGWWLVSQRLKRHTPSPLLIADVPLDGPVAPVLEAFGGAHAYNNADLTVGKNPAASRAWADVNYPVWTKRWGAGVTSLTIMPGFGNRKATASPISRMVTDRYGGETYDVLARAAARARPDWLLLTSWNEWHEGSEIEPSVEDGTRALEQTQIIARHFKALAPRMVSIAQR